MIPAAEFRYDQERECYLLGDERVERVSEILAGAGLVDKSFYTEYHAMRGRYAHAAAHYLELGELVWPAEDDPIYGHIVAYDKFLKDTGYKSTAIEEPRYHPIHRYAGTPDRVGYLNGKPVIIDLKSGRPQAWHALQLAAYHLLIKTPLVPRYDRYALYLDSGGNYQLKHYRDNADETVFLSALAIHRWRKSNG